MTEILYVGRGKGVNIKVSDDARIKVLFVAFLLHLHQGLRTIWD